MNFFVCIKLPNSCIYAIKLRGKGGGDVWNVLHFLQGNCVFDNYNTQKCQFLWSCAPGFRLSGGLTATSPPPNSPAVITSLRSLCSLSLGFFAPLGKSSSFFINFCSHACTGYQDPPKHLVGFEQRSFQF